jgi:hypothetical protein
MDSKPTTPTAIDNAARTRSPTPSTNNTAQPLRDDAAFTRLSKLVATLRARPDAEWAFTHCLPWEYAGLCAALWHANQALSAAPSAAAIAALPWRPAACYPENLHKRPHMTAELWSSLAVAPDELWEAYNLSRVPRRVEGQLGLARWVLSVSLGDGKTLDVSDGAVSGFLYQHAHYVYNWGIGESYFMELVAIAVLSFFLFFTSFLDEIQQLMHQACAPNRAARCCCIRALS